MRKSQITVVCAAVLALLLGAACTAKKAEIEPSELALFAPLPDTIPAKAGGPVPERVALGRMLYYEPRLSKNQKISCNTCHDLNNFGVDGHPTSDGHKGQKGDRNSPTVYNAAAQFVQFWDGRSPDVEDQAKGPVVNPVEMAMGSEKDVVSVLKSMPEYVAAFKKAYPEAKDPVTFANMADAIGTFERGLITPSRWDKFLKGDRAALTEEEKAGFKAFNAQGCQACHAGALLGGNLYQRIGAMKRYPDESDPGRYKVTKVESDRFVFKVPTLRNIEKTGPYFHNGKVETLEDAIVRMSEYQLGKQPDSADVKSIAAFLRALTGEVPAEYIKQPTLPQSTPKTPKPSEAD
ncbi:MAG: cytochrome-c peroxidase [Bryobacteraceae bacterium]